MFSLSIKEGLLQDKLNEIRTDTRASVCLQEGTISFEMLADLYERFWSRDSSVTMEQLVKSGSIPVSYTHLDVYKRQVEDSQESRSVWY